MPLGVGQGGKSLGRNPQEQGEVMFLLLRSQAEGRLEEHIIDSSSAAPLKDDLCHGSQISRKPRTPPQKLHVFLQGRVGRNSSPFLSSVLFSLLQEQDTLPRSRLPLLLG